MDIIKNYMTFNMMKSSILIIANGPSTLDNQFGDIIDTFDNVARINNYKTSNFENCIGSKTTIWFNGANKKLTPRPEFEGKIVVFVPYEILNKKEKDVIERTPKRLKLSPDRYDLISKEKMKSYENIANVKRPTTGLNSIMWSLENYEKIFIHGFDFFLTGKEHYYDSNFKKKIANLRIVRTAKKHDNTGERDFVKSLLKQNRLIKLSDYINKGK